METRPVRQDAGSKRCSPPALPSLDIALEKGFPDTRVPKRCDFCNRAFSGSVHRCRPGRSHTQNRTFKCMKCRSTFSRRDLLLRHDHIVHAEDDSLSLSRDIPKARAVKARTASPIDNKPPPIDSPSHETPMPVLPSMFNSLPNSGAGTPIPSSPWTAESQAGFNAPQVSGDEEVDAALDNSSWTDFEHAVPSGFDPWFTPFEFAGDVNIEHTTNALRPLATPRASLGNGGLKVNCAIASQERCTHQSLKQARKFSEDYGNSLSLASTLVEDWASEIPSSKKFEWSNDSGYLSEPTNRSIAYSIGQGGTTENEPRHSDGCINSWMDNAPSPPLVGSVEMAESGASDSEYEDSIDLCSDSSASEEYSEPACTLEWDPSGEIVSTLKREYIKSLLSSFQLLQRQCPADTGSNERHSGSLGGSANGKQRDNSSLSNTDTGSRPAKRRKINGAEDNSDEGEEDNHQQRVPWPSTQKKQVKGPIFACPFAKRFPDRYGKCYSHKHRTVSRVKGHLSRATYHHLPLYCPKCSETFKDRRLHDEHSRANNCPILPSRSWDGITPEQFEQLSKRTSPKKTAEENWYDVYKIIFPGKPLPNSPYIDGKHYALREHLLSQGPEIARAFLRKRLPPHLQQHSEELHSLLTSFIQEAIDIVLEELASNNQKTTSLPSQYRTQETSIPAGSNDILAGGALDSPQRPDSAIGNSVSGSSENERKLEQQQLEQPGPEQQQITTQAGTQPMVQPSLMYQTMPSYTTLPQFPTQVLQSEACSNSVGQISLEDTSQQPSQAAQMGQLVPLTGSGDLLDPMITNDVTSWELWAPWEL